MSCEEDVYRMIELSEEVRRVVEFSSRAFLKILERVEELREEDECEDLGGILPDRYNVKVYEPGDVIATQYFQLLEALTEGREAEGIEVRLSELLSPSLEKYVGSWFECIVDVELRLVPPVHAVHVMAHERGLACGPVDVYTEYLLFLKPSEGVLEAASFRYLSIADEVSFKVEGPIPFDSQKKAVEEIVDRLLSFMFPPETISEQSKAKLETMKREVLEKLF